MLTLDHLAVSCGVLADGRAWAEAALGVPLQDGGQHPHFGTHNALLGMGAEYFEVIAIDPEVAPLPHARWFALDRFSGPPRLTNWILRCADLEAALAALGSGYGTPVALTRGSLRWRMAVPESGVLPFDNCAPALIQWDTEPPLAALTPRGCEITALEVRHPDAQALRDTLAGLFNDPRVIFAAGAPALSARILTPTGSRVI